MSKIKFFITAKQVILINKSILEDRFATPKSSQGKVESALHSAFYPGDYPFAHGGIAKIAAAICFYLTKNHPFIDGNKRTSILAADVFIRANGYALEYPLNGDDEWTELAKVVDSVAAGKLDLDQLKDWFDAHKVRIENL